MPEDTQKPAIPVVILGTRAQLIKMAPVIIELENRNIHFIFILTGQHKDTIGELLADFNIKTKPKYLFSDDEVNSISKVPLWFIRCILNFRYKKKFQEIFKNQNCRYAVLIHGDTFSTILGALLGKLIDAVVVHVEAGLRSFNYFHPFPEEITRLLVFYISDVSFCPGEYAMKNMENFDSKKIDTKYNTIIDTIKLIFNEKQLDTSTNRSYVVCSIHRFENIFLKKRLKKIVSIIEEISLNKDILFVLHPATKRNLIKYKLFEKLENNNRINLSNRMNYSEFIKKISGAEFVLTDGGSNQEELYYLGIPTLLLRKKTERTEGINETTLISNYEKDKINTFINNINKYKSINLIKTIDTPPSEIIVNHIIKL